MAREVKLKLKLLSINLLRAPKCHQWGNHQAFKQKKLKNYFFCIFVLPALRLPAWFRSTALFPQEGSEGGERHTSLFLLVSYFCLHNRGLLCSLVSTITCLSFDFLISKMRELDKTMSQNFAQFQFSKFFFQQYFLPTAPCSSDSSWPHYPGWNLFGMKVLLPFLL